VWRRIRQRATPRPKDDVVECTIDGRPVTADPLALLGVTAELYRRAVAPQQASLIALVSLKSKERNAALDRLFGIEELNLLAEGMSKAKLELPRSLKELERRLDQAESGLWDEITRRFDQRATARGNALEAGIERRQLNLEGCRSLAATLASELALPSVPEGAGLSELQVLHQQFVRVADAGWSRLEPQDRHDRLTQIQGVLERGAPALWKLAIADRDAARRALETLRGQLGTEAEVEGRVIEADVRVSEAEQELSAANERAALLKRAREWLHQHELPPEKELDCPVCERPVVATELTRLVEAALNGLERSDGTIAGLLAQVNKARETRAALVKDKEQLDQAVQELQAREHAVTGRRSKLPDILQAALEPWRARKPDDVEARTIELLRQALDATATADDGLLAQQWSLVADACKQALSRTDEELRQAGPLAEQRRRRVIALERLLTFLQAAERLDALDADVSGVELAQARNSLGAAHRAGDVLTRVAAAAGEIAEAEAKARTTAVAAGFDTWFGRVSRHDRLKGARIEVETSRTGGRLRNSYRLRAVDSRSSWELRRARCCLVPTRRCSPSRPSAHSPMPLDGGWTCLCSTSRLSTLTRSSPRVLEEPSERLCQLRGQSWRPQTLPLRARFKRVPGSGRGSLSSALGPRRRAPRLPHDDHPGARSLSLCGRAPRACPRQAGWRRVWPSYPAAGRRRPGAALSRTSREPWRWHAGLPLERAGNGVGVGDQIDIFRGDQPRGARHRGTAR